MGASSGQVAASSDGSLTIVQATFHGFFNYLLMLEPDGRWFEQGFKGPHADDGLGGGAIEISPDDATLLVADINRVLKYRTADVSTRGLGPFEAVTIDPTVQKLGALPQQILPAAIEFTADSRTAYVVVNDGFVYTLDVEAMAWRSPPIAYPTMDLPMHYLARRTIATLSPDEQWLVINGGDLPGGVLVLVDVRTGQASQLPLPVTVQRPDETWGVAFNYYGPNRGLLAVHGRYYVAVYAFDNGKLTFVTSTQIAAPGELSWRMDGRWVARFAALAWSGDGTRIIANQGGATEWRIFELSATDPRQLTSVAVFESCLCNDLPGNGRPQGYDIVTIQRRPTLTTTPTASHTPTITLTPTTTLTPSITLSPTATATTPLPTATPRATSTPTAAATATLRPVPRYLPLALRERCTIDQKHADVALVIDASTTMRDDRTATGRTKLDAAIEAAGAFVAALALPLDQAAVVVFNSDAQVVMPLTGRRGDIDAALARIPGLVYQQTRIDLGIQRAHEELASPRHKSVNQAVMILLTDGLANPEPASTAVRRAQEAKDDGIAIFTIGLGKDSELNVVELAQIASRPEFFYRAPDGEDLLAIYRTIAVEIPCPAQAFWGRR